MLSGPITPGHSLSPIFDLKVMSIITSNLEPRLLKILSHLAKPYHLLLHLNTLYVASLIEE